MMVSTFMPEAFQQGHIIQAQQLTDIHIICENTQFIRRISEQEVLLSKKRWIEELEALHLLSPFAKEHLSNIGQRLGKEGQ